MLKDTFTIQILNWARVGTGLKWLRTGSTDGHMNIFMNLKQGDRPCGLVVRIPGYRARGPEFDSRGYQIF
jgi:hypothetical protein